MSNMPCHCGALISNVQYPSPTEGDIRTERDLEIYEDRIEKTIASFLLAVSLGSRDNWIAEFFGPDYSKEFSDAALIADIRIIYEREYLLSVCECQGCGRLYIQKVPGKNEYVCFEPRSGTYEAILERKGAEQNHPAHLD